MPELKHVYTIPNTWILIFQINDNLYYLDCKEILDFPYANEVGLDINEFQHVTKHKTKVSWHNDEIDICISRLLEDGIMLVD